MPDDLRNGPAYRKLTAALDDKGKKKPSIRQKPDATRTELGGYRKAVAERSRATESDKRAVERENQYEAIRHEEPSQIDYTKAEWLAQGARDIANSDKRIADAAERAAGPLRIPRPGEGPEKYLNVTREKDAVDHLVDALRAATAGRARVERER